MPRNLTRRVEEEIRALAHRTVDAMIAKGPELDFVKEVSGPYPLRVVMQILGVPEADEPRWQCLPAAVRRQDADLSGTVHGEHDARTGWSNWSRARFALSRIILPRWPRNCREPDRGRRQRHRQRQRSTASRCRPRDMGGPITSSSRPPARTNDQRLGPRGAMTGAGADPVANP